LKVLRRPVESIRFTGHEWQTFLREHNLVGSTSRRGNCHDNAVAESFFQLLKRERVRRQICVTRNDARADIFNYIEMFFDSKRRHGTAATLRRSSSNDAIPSARTIYIASKLTVTTAAKPCRAAEPSAGPVVSDSSRPARFRLSKTFPTLFG